MVSFEETIFRTPTNNAMMLSVSGVLANDFVQCGVVGDQNLDVCINVTNKISRGIIRWTPDTERPTTEQGQFKVATIMNRLASSVSENNLYNK